MTYNANRTLTREIKKELHRLNVKFVLLVFGLLGAIGGAVLLVSFYLVGLPLHGILVLSLPTFGISMLMSGFGAGALTGSVVIVALLKYSAQKVKPYANIPREIDELRDEVIDLGSYIAAPDNEKTYEPFNEPWRNRIRNLESNDSDKDQVIKELKQRLTKYEENDGLYMSEIRRLNSKITERDEFIKKHLSEQSKTETEEKDAQTIKKDNRFESI